METIENKYCPECNAENAPYAITCKECGFPFDKQIVCIECGNVIPNGKESCPTCGAPKSLSINHNLESAVDKRSPEEKKEGEIKAKAEANSSRKNYASYVLFAGAILLLIISVKIRFFGDYNRYNNIILNYQDNISEYRDTKAEHEASARSFSSGFFSSSYSMLADSYQDLIDDAYDRIAYYESLKRRILVESIGGVLLACLLSFIGLKLLNKKST